MRTPGNIDDNLYAMWKGGNIMRRSVFRSMIMMVALFALPFTAGAAQVVLDVTGYGYNTISGGLGADGQTGAIGCGPTTGAMIMEYYTRHGATGLITDPLADARLMGAGPLNPVNNSPTYMNTNSNGFGPSSQFQFGFESFAADRSYDINAAIHVEPTSFNAASWPGYTVGTNLITDANFWNTTTWDINDAAFISFIKAEIDAGRPLSASVYGDPDFAAGTILNTGYTYGGATHWMPLVGYDDVTNQWAGYNTWDSTLHWYDTTSAFFDTIAGGNLNVPNMSIAFARTFLPMDFTLTGDFFSVDTRENGNGGGSPVPEPGTMMLLGSGLVGLVGYGRRRLKK